MSLAKLQTVFLFALFLLFCSLGSGYAFTTKVSLNEPTKKFSEINIVQGSAVNVSNEFETALYNLVLVKASSATRMMRFEEFGPGQSFELEFPRQGTYMICYSHRSNQEMQQDSCLQINVGAFNKA